MRALYYPNADRDRQRFPSVEANRPEMNPNVLLLHTTEGNGWPGYQNGGSAPHFTYRAATREWRQHFPVNRAAMALADAPGGVATNRLNVVQVEISDTTSGWASAENPGRPYTIARKSSELSDDNLRDLAELYAWLNREWGVPLSMTPRGFVPWNAKRPTMSNDEWNAFRGLCGHQHVPENDHTDPGAINAGRILDIAKNLVNAGGTPPPAPAPRPPEEPRMEVIGSIGDYWRAKGGTASVFGQPTGPEEKTAAGAFTPFSNDTYILWSPETGAHESRGEIRKAFARAGFEQGVLGYPTSDETKTPDGTGIFQSYQGGMIYCSRLGTFVVRGAILTAWAALGYERGRLGYPTSDEREGDKPGRVQTFAGGRIAHSRMGDQVRTFPVWGSMLDRYARDGYEGGRWGYPGGGEVFRGDRWFQGFDGGIMSVPESVPPPNPGPTSRYVRPITRRSDTEITQHWDVYNSRYRSKEHNGVDIAAPYGEPIYATIGGVVVSYEDEPGYGDRIRIKGDDGLYWAYNHTSAITVRVGQRVKTGQQIGRVGTSGNVTGPHLCLEAYPGSGMAYNTDVNPNRWP